jgi:hypothetical protein
MLRKKLAVVAAAALPLTGVALFGGIQAVSAAGGPTLTCTALAPAVDAGALGGITFTNVSGGGQTGVSLNSNAAQSAIIVPITAAQIAAFEADGFSSAAGFTVTTGSVTNGDDVVTINKGVVAGQTLTVTGFTGTYTVLSDVSLGAGLVTPDQVTLTTDLEGGTPIKGVVAKAKGIVTVNATDGTNGTTAYNGAVNENVAMEGDSCSSSANLPGSFAPTTVDINATTAATNSASGLELPPGALDGSITLPAIGPDYTQPVATTFGFDIVKDNKLNLTDFDESFAKGVVLGDYATTKAALDINALANMTVCTSGELAAITDTPYVAIDPVTHLAETPVPNGGPDSTNNGGPIHTGASPLAVCDGGTDMAYPITTLPPSLGGGTEPTAGVGEILAVELDPSGNPPTGDGTAVSEIVEIQATNDLPAVL